MKHYESYEKTQTYSEKKHLPVGGYIVRIISVESGENDYGEYADLFFDISEGDYKDFFLQDYSSQFGEDKKWRGKYRLRAPRDDGSEQDNWTSRRFKTDIAAFEDSNPGYHWNWDERTLKDKTVGVLYAEREYDFNGYQGTSTECRYLISADNVRTGNFKIPAVKKPKSGKQIPVSGPEDDFMNIPAEANPFGV